MDSSTVLLERTLVLGAAAGVVIGELFLLISTIAIGDWGPFLVWGYFLLPVGVLAGGLDGMLALAAVLLLGRRLRRFVPLASLVGGLAAAAVPLSITFHAGWPHGNGGALPGIGLSAAAFVAAAGLAWPVLTGRPRLLVRWQRPAADRPWVGAAWHPPNADQS
ncbi:MAG: hypothetical protein ACJ74U_12210 [Jatrophihabitantaceae bacterium]